MSESPPDRPLASVELPRPLEPRPEISHVLFDFDGTLSLIRQGWPEVMVPMFVEALPPRPGETEDDAARDGPRRHHAAQRQADDLPDDPARRPDPRARRRARTSRSGTSTSTCAGWSGTSAPGPPGWPAARSPPTNCSSTAPGPCSSTCAASGCRSTWPAGPTNTP